VFLVLVLAVPPWAASLATACPFCGTVGQSLAQRRDAAAVVAVAEAEGPATADPSSVLMQRFRIDQVLRDTAHTAAVGTTVPARVAGPIAGTAVLFGSASAATPEVAANDRSWSAIAATSRSGSTGAVIRRSWPRCSNSSRKPRRSRLERRAWPLPPVVRAEPIGEPIAEPLRCLL
jgi:hypothetical protein